MLGWIHPVVDGVEKHQNDEVETAVGIDDEGPEALVRLDRLPEQHDHLWSPPDRLLAARQVGGGCTQGLMERPRHTFANELEVLSPMQAAKEVAEVVLLRCTFPILGDRV